MRVRYTPLGWLDLDHIQAVEDAEFVDRMGFGGWYAEFRVWLMFREEPLVYSHRFDETEYRFVITPDKSHHEALLTDGSWTKDPQDNETNIAAVANLQKKVDALVAEWRSGV